MGVGLGSTSIVRMPNGADCQILRWSPHWLVAIVTAMRAGCDANAPG
jgi:hypothetical protein